MIYAKIAVNAPLDSTFDYHVPPAFEAMLQVGHLVEIPFGKRAETGLVVEIHDQPPDMVTKPITDVLDPRPFVNAEQIEIAQWMSQAYRAPIGTCLWLWLPVGLSAMRDSRYTLSDRDGVDDSAKTAGELDLIDLLRRRGSLLSKQIVAALPGAEWRVSMDALVKIGAVTRESVIAAPRIKPKLAPMATLNIPEDQIEHALVTLSAAKRPPKAEKLEIYARVLRVLARESRPIENQWIYAQTEASKADLKKLNETGFIALGEHEILRDSLAGRHLLQTFAPTFTPQQAAAWDRISQAGAGERFLLHGVTGSGKTEIYLRAIETALHAGKTAIFLVPEIALTPQTIDRVAQRFPNQVGILHSGISDGERFDTWRRAREGKLRVIVGARSALFAPLPHLGVIILDEEHDHSFKQSANTQPPHYHARTTAEQIAKQRGAVVIMGSATPDVETYQRAVNGEITLLELPQRVMGHAVSLSGNASEMIELPPVHVVDMRRELKAGNTSIFSRPLRAALSETLERGEQAILFLNRRGQATYIFCRDCGYVVKCPNCDSPLTYHRHGSELRCHKCGYTQLEPKQCPDCKSARIKYFGAGTQQVEQALAEMFPAARPLRWDADTASDFTAHEADVLIGTQMVAKGLDIPHVTLVGVVSADVGINLPDFRAGERTFQLLTQVAGRAGRGMQRGQVVLQTYQPEHYAIQAAAQHDYATFFEREIAYRRQIGYPPFRRLIRILFRYPNETKTKAEASRAAALIRNRLKALGMTGTELIGPAPCFFMRENNVFRWHLMLRGPDPLPALAGMQIPSGWHVDIDPVEVL
jgi:primosomal protein N' (replication factor Y) (superfamily II helicase)